MARQPIDNRRNVREQSLGAPKPAPDASPAPQAPLRGNPANENDPGTAMVIRRLRRAPSYDVIYWSIAFAIAWAGFWFWSYREVFYGQKVTTPGEGLQAIALLFLPVIGILAIAFFIWRTQQLRQVSEILMQQAMRLIRPQDLATDGLTSIAQAVRQEVDLLVGGVEHALQRATMLEEIVHKEIANVERAFGSNEDRIRTLVNGLETQRAALQQTSNLVNADAQPMLQRLESNTQNLNQVVNLALNTFDRLEGSLKSSTNELSQTIETVATRASETSQEIGNHSSQFERMSTMLVSDFRGFSAQLQDYVQSLSFTASNLGSETQRFGAEVKGMEHSLIGQLQASTTRLVQAHESVNQSVEHLAATAQGSAQQTTNEFLQSFGQMNERMTAQLKGTVTETAGLLEQVSDTVNSQLRGTASQTSQIIEQASGQVTGGLQDITVDYLQKIHAARTELVGQANQSTTRMVEELDAANSRFHDRFNISGSQLVEILDQTSNTFVTRLGASGSGLMGSIQQSAENYAGSLMEAATRFENAGGVLSQSIGRTTSLATQEMQAVGSNVNDLLVSTSGMISAHLKETSEIVSRQMQDSGLALAQNIEASGGNVTDRLISVSGEFVQRLNLSRDSLVTTFLGTANELISKMDETSGSIHARMMDTGNHVTDRLVSVSGDFVQQINATRDELVTTFVGTSGQLISKMDETSSAIHARFMSTGNQVTEHLDTMSIQITERLDGTLGAAGERINSVTETLTTRLDKSSTQLGALMTATERRLGNQLEQATSELEALFGQNTKMMTDQLEQSSTLVTNTFAETAVQTAHNLNTAGNEVTAQINSASETMFNRLHGTTLDLGKRFDVATEHLTSVTSEVSKRMDNQGGRFVELLDQASGQIFTDLGKARDAFSEGLGETTLQISGRFEQETGLLVGRIDRAVQEFDSAATTTSTRFEDVSQRFSKHLSGANTIMSNQLATTATDIDSKLEVISTQLTGKLETTGSRISERLEDVSSLVDKSIDKFNLEMEHTLQSRRDMLDNLVSDANRRAAEVDKSMAGYMSVIEESLAATEQRALHIGRIVSDQSTAALSRLEEELRKLETNSSSQVAQAARALREQHERALSNMNEMLSSTASDFQQTAQDMRITAQQVVKDIDAARGELKRAVIDLPDETRTNADAMRRVVADQIGALNALAEVVRKQTGTLDFSGPGFMPARSPQPRGETMIAQSRPAASALARPEPAPPTNTRLSALAKEVEATNAKLNIAARDIVEAVEGQLPRDLERRYSASEKSVYTTRLYESRSRKLVKALEGRYAEERLLRSRVQAYNRLFEKLLDSFGGIDGGDAVMEQVLASEQGRIYVMLAEVSGRLPSQS